MANHRKLTKQQFLALKFVITFMQPPVRDAITALGLPRNESLRVVAKYGWSTRTAPGRPAKRKVVGGYKQCSRCKRVLPITEFGQDSHARRGLHYHCRRCHAFYTAQTRQAPELHHTERP